MDTTVDTNTACKCGHTLAEHQCSLLGDIVDDKKCTHKNCNCLKFDAVVVQDSFLIKLMKEHRVGKFILSERLLISIDKNTLLSALFGSVVIYRAEFMGYNRAIEYIGYSEHFDSVEEGNIPPTYDVFVKKDPETGEFKSLTWKRIKDE